MNPHDVISLCNELPPIRLRDPLMQLHGLLQEGELAQVRLGDLLRQADLFHPHVAAAFRLCALAAATLEEQMEGAPSRDDLLVVVRGQERDLSNGLLARTFSLVFGAFAEDGFKGFGPHHRRRRRLWFEQEDFDYNTVDVIHWQSGYGARVRFEPEELPYSIPLNNLIFAQDTRTLTGEEREEFARLWARSVYEALFSPEATGEKVYFCEPLRNVQHPLREQWLQTLTDTKVTPAGQRDNMVR